ncbi:hypothetical protein XM38_034250 [Halomicronema hongdechloris C2206]|uniref:Uncharacterized protein n=1 Tax=Halomicronema hongdechloris C2206 TaxID=1641165 RepID=A0A1Z3HQ94_9CYAN|nr:hypothetical protein [Halomicronema hongdechloris]ASC72468.1 hypothetical protein XM38_034250 [Halomicronema hongdechloris C2206]
MKIDRPGAPELTPEEQHHLNELKRLVQQAVADGRLSRDESDRIRRAIHADGKVTFEELQMIRETIHTALGSADLEIDWD